MGICSSCEATNVATAKLIQIDGRLQEFPYPVKVSYVLQKNPACFICNSDEMDFDDVVSPVSDDEELIPGQLYFALPLNRLSRRLQAEEMAALAVKASSALSGSVSGGGVFCVEKCRNPDVVSSENRGRRGAVDGGEVRTHRRRPSGSGRKQSFSASLSVIPE